MVEPIHSIDKKSGTNSISPNASTSPNKVNQPSFAEVLADKNKVRFSNHAQKRLETRAITLDDNQITRLTSAVDKAKAHGGKDSLILMDDLAFIVNIKENLIVTTIDVNQNGEGVFTKIDSVVIAKDEEENANG